MPLVSVIVPVYKAEKWLHRCVDSILAQTMTDFELLLIDDGSPDRSGEICDEYVTKDSRVRVFHKDNGGEMSARFEGWKNVKGKFLMFVDADDELPNDTLEIMLSFMFYDVNIVCGKFLFYDVETSLILDSTEKIEFNKVSAEEYKKKLFQGKENLSLSGKLYRSEIVMSSVFSVPREIKKGPDAIGSVKIAFNNDKNVLFINKVVYCYRQHSESCLHTFVPTPEHEQIFYDNLWLVVPDDYRNEYIKYLIYNKIQTFDAYFGHSVDKPIWIGSEFHKKLLEEIKLYNYRGQLIPQLLLRVTNKNMRRILIHIRRFVGFLFRLKNKIKFL